MTTNHDAVAALGKLERDINQHRDAEVKNLRRLQTVLHRHTTASCKVLSALLQAFPDRKVVAWVEPEISELGCTARPEDLVLWIEHIGLFVLEVKSHTIQGIRRFENNVPQVIYDGLEDGDVDLLDQPYNFAYKLKGTLDKICDEIEQLPPALYYAGCLPHVSPEDVAGKGATVAPDRVWLSDMLDREVFLARLPLMKNITRGTNGERSLLDRICGVFGSTSGVRRTVTSRSPPVGMGQLITRKNLQLKRLTKEQEDLAFSPNLLRGPKVIRGVAGSGKTVVLANAVAETFLRAMGDPSGPSLFPDGGDRVPPNMLVLCYNRVLVPYLSQLIRQCFEQRKPVSTWIFPTGSLKVLNIDRFAYGLAQQGHVSYDVRDIASTVKGLLDAGPPQRGMYQHVLIDEGQDIDLAWFPLVRTLVSSDEECGPSIVVFYDEAQNLYGVKRPNVGNVPPWKDHLGAVPNNRGLHTVMRVGHRNTNPILSFSFNLLLGAVADVDPQMAQFAGMNEYEKEVIPNDPAIDHPNSGKPCVERVDGRHYRVNFAISNGPAPTIHGFSAVDDMLSELAKEVERVIDPKRGGVEPSDVLIMVPEKKDVAETVQVFVARNIPVHVPVKIDEGIRGKEPRDLGCFLPGKVTVSTIKSAKGYTAHVCHLAFVHKLDGEGLKKDMRQKNRAQLHVACTRSSLFLHLWGLFCPLLAESEKARELLR